MDGKRKNCGYSSSGSFEVDSLRGPEPDALILLTFVCTSQRPSPRLRAAATAASLRKRPQHFGAVRQGAAHDAADLCGHSGGGGGGGGGIVFGSLRFSRR